MIYFHYFLIFSTYLKNFSFQLFFESLTFYYLI